MISSGRLLIYGANGYTGGLIARAAVERGLRPILAGRGLAVRRLAEEVRQEGRIFNLQEPSNIDAALEGVQVVLNAAGPFAHTAAPLVEACLRTGTHYLDITGEIPVMEDLARRDGEARHANVMLLPGAGFDVVPTDCLAVHVKKRLPSATRLAIGIQVTGGLVRGTLATTLEQFPNGAWERRNGRLEPVLIGWKSHSFPLEDGSSVTGALVPLGDLCATFHSTGILNIEVYMVAAAAVRLGLKMAAPFVWMLGLPPARAVLQSWIARIGEPSAGERLRGKSVLWAEATDENGQRAMSRIQGGDGHTITVQAALAIVERIHNGDVAPGFQTPARAYGPDLILECDGISRTDVN